MPTKPPADITLSPAQVVALGERPPCAVHTGGDGPNGDARCAMALPADDDECNTAAELGASTAQARLNSG